MLKIREISHFDQFIQLKDRWSGLLERSQDDHVYLTWEFLSIYLKHFFRGQEVKILYAEDGENLLAIAPLRLSKYRYFKNAIGYRVIEPLAYRLADYTGIVLAERKLECINSLLTYLLEQGGWDFMYLYDLPENSTLKTMLPTFSKMNLRNEFVQGAVCPYIELPADIETFMNSLNTKFRKNLRTSTRNLEKDHKKVKLKKYDELGQIEEAMDIFFKLHQKRWESKGFPGVFSTQFRRDFSLDLAKCFASKGWLALYFLTVDDEPVAVQNCVEYKKKMYYGLGGMDPDFSQYSVGNIIQAKVLEECVHRGIREFDFLKGGATTVYKFDWCSSYRRNFGIKIISNKLISNIYNSITTLARRMKIDRMLYA